MTAADVGRTVQDSVGVANAAACVVHVVWFLTSGGFWLPGLGTLATGAVAWWLLRDGEGCQHDWDDIEVRAFAGTRLTCRKCGAERG